MRVPMNMSGHFRSLWTPMGNVMVPTTITTQKKSKARAKESAKREQLAQEMQAAFGTRPAMIARSIDGISRRWTGVRANGAD